MDCELDWGGRTKGNLGIRYGLPLILDEFNKNNIKALFFISTELLNDYKKDIKRIQDYGHTLGSHGHFHIVYKDKWRAHADMQISKLLLSGITGKPDCYYRAPKFNYQLDNEPYSRRDGMSLLKMMWTGQRSENIYLHPFDLVTAKNPPNTFCRLWYSRPKKACKLFKELCKS